MRKTRLARLLARRPARPALSGRAVEALDKGEEPDASCDEPGDGVVRVKRKAHVARHEGSDAWIIDQIRTLGTVTVCGLSKLPVKLSSESCLFPVSTIAPQDISGSSQGVAFGGVIPDANGHVPMEGACRRGTGCFQRIAHHRTQVIGELDDGHESLLALTVEANGGKSFCYRECIIREFYRLGVHIAQVLPIADNDLTPAG
jgi:hypothetical protein